MTRDRGDKIGDAFAHRGDGPQDGRLPFGAQLAQGEHLREVTGGLVRARSVRLVHDKDVGDLEDTGLDRLDVVAEARHRDEADRVDDAHDIDLLLSHPDRLDEDDAVPDRVEHVHDARSRARESPGVTAARHAAYEQAFVERAFLHADPVAKKRAAAER